jgi:hypothetical protein
MENENPIGKAVYDFLEVCSQIDISDEETD